MHKKDEAKKSQIDSHLIMDDIIDKLKLLDYEQTFMMKPISRIFFSHYEEEKNFNKVEYMYEIGYWLMSRSKKKRIGIYMPFKKHKSSEEAVKRMIEDCKKFGVKFSKYFEEQEFLQGFGDSVGYLIDELLNRELIRRGYKFGTPVIPPDEEEADDDVEEEKFDNNVIDFQDKVASDSPSKLKNGDIEEDYGQVTKTNFFPTGSVVGAQADEELIDLNDSMINGEIDPDQWYAEVERVKSQLVLDQKDQNMENLDPLQEYLNDLGNFSDRLKYARNIIEGMQGDESSAPHGKKIKITHLLNKLVDSITGDLHYIAKEEKRINSSNAIDISKLNKVAVNKSEYMQELGDLTERMKIKIQTFDDLTAKCKEAYAVIESKSKTIEGTAKLEAIKKAINSIKADVFKLDLRIGVIRASLNHKEESKEEKHHLYDDDQDENFDV